MLTSNNQYLRPEYLTPLPTTLDAKKSPLALLAQTCSQIGADTPNSKLLQSAEKSKSNKSEGNKEKTSSSNGDNVQKSGFKSYTASLSREKSGTPEDRSSSASTGSRVRTPLTLKSNISDSNNGRCSSSQSANSPRTSPEISERKTPAGEINGSSDRVSPEKSNESTSRTTPVTSSSSKTAFTPNILTSSSDPAIKDLPLGTFKPGVPSSPVYLRGYPVHEFPFHIDLLPSSLMSQHHALKANQLNPYLAYSRMKTSESLSPVCREPFCTGCNVNSHLLAASGATGKTPSSCPAGCSQCDHAKPPTSSAYLGHNSAVAAYAHAQLALAAASHLPYVCNWIAGDAAYCGKRFSTSEELLSHLRTHTSVSVSEASTALSMLSSSGLPSAHPLLHRTYPTPPLSPLATTRYHPYSKPSPLLPPSLSSTSFPGFPLSHPGLPSYLSPYSLYGPRIGSAPGMHP